MTKNNKGRAPGKDATPKTTDSRNHAPNPGGWRGALAAGVGGFRINGSYDAPASDRRARRILQRKIAKALRKSGGAS